MISGRRGHFKYLWSRSQITFLTHTIHIQKSLSLMIAMHTATLILATLSSLPLTLASPYPPPLLPSARKPDPPFPPLPLPYSRPSQTSTESEALSSWISFPTAIPIPDPDPEEISSWISFPTNIPDPEEPPTGISLPTPKPRACTKICAVKPITSCPVGWRTERNGVS